MDARSGGYDARTALHLAGTEGHWVTPDFDPIVIYSHFMSGWCLFNA